MVINIDVTGHIEYALPRRISRLGITDQEHETCVNGIMVLGKMIGDSYPIKYVLPRRISPLGITDHKAKLLSTG